MKGLARTDAGYLFFNLAGQAIAALVMLPATFCAGMTLPLITGALLRRGAGERAIGQVYAANTLGAIAGVLIAVHLGLPLLGLKGTLIAGRAGRCAARPRPALPVRAGGAGRCAAAAAGLPARVRAARPAVRTRSEQDDRGRVPPRRPVELGRRAASSTRGTARPRPCTWCGYGDDDQHPHQRQVRRFDQHGPRRRARLRRDHHGADRCAAACAQSGGEERRGDRHRHRPDHARPAAEPGDRARRDRRDRGGDGGGGARLRAAQQLGLRRSARQHRDRRRQDLLLDAQPALRHPGLRALQPLGERRLGPVHARVLPAHPRPSQPGRPAGAVVPALRDRRLAARLGDARAGRGIPALRGVRAERPRPADRRLGRCARRRSRTRRCSRSPMLAQELRDRARAGPGRLRRALPRQPRHAGAAVRELRHAGELGLLPGAGSQRRAPPLHRQERH